jgi:nucleotide sugar dehydrogenase
MRVQIIGVGAVGSAQAYLCSQLGHEVIGVDPSRASFDYARITRTPEKDVDLTFVCTPEAFVPSVVADLVEKNVKGLFVIKSTVPSGTTVNLMKKHNIHICHNPEFLREDTSFYDITHPNAAVVGQCCAEHGEILNNFYKVLRCPVIMSRPTVTETVKLTLNCYLSTLISFWNEINKISGTLGINTREVADIVKADRRVSDYGTRFFGSPFGGKCLPKDLDQLIKVYQNLGADSSMLEAIRAFNKTV